MSASARLSLPFLSVGQAQKEFTHNEALQVLDSLVAGAVEEPPRASPPATAALGACYIIDAAPTDEWSAYPSFVAAWTSGGWRFSEPVDGMNFLVRSNGLPITFRSGAWEMGTVRAAALVIGDEQVVGSRAAAIASPSGGTAPDSEARAAIDAILAALRQHGLIET
jgi:hypothetical protein